MDPVTSTPTILIETLSFDGSCHALGNPRFSFGSSTNERLLRWMMLPSFLWGSKCDRSMENDKTLNRVPFPVAVQSASGTYYKGGTDNAEACGGYAESQP